VAQGQRGKIGFEQGCRHVRGVIGRGAS
jgi:hypothetical protein